jgi:hypothetical protein
MIRRTFTVTRLALTSNRFVRASFAIVVGGMLAGCPTLIALPARTSAPARTGAIAISGTGYTANKTYTVEAQRIGGPTVTIGSVIADSTGNINAALSYACGSNLTNQALKVSVCETRIFDPSMAPGPPTNPGAPPARVPYTACFIDTTMIQPGCSP